jgi:hypothetical protein
MGGAILALATLMFTCFSGKPVGNGATHPPPAIVAVDAIPDVSLHHGETTSVAVSITVADGYHVQANPASGEFLVPLELQLDPVEGLGFGAAEYPKATPYRLENSEDILKTYEGTFAVNVPITALKAGALDVSGKVRYQACDSKRCLFPSTVPFAFKIIVAQKSSKGAGS